MWLFSCSEWLFVQYVFGVVARAVARVLLGGC